MPFQPVYLLMSMKVKNSTLLGEYFQAVGGMLPKYGIELVSTGTSTVTVLEGSWDHQRTALLKAPTRSAWFAFYESTEYESIKPMREKAAESMVALFDGLDFSM
ncbi:DUF1330 domain-containing protein [Rubritalea tangerina]|uniref:DUF1330 domain-containing protein n=1 Tax=Rubritalea tangerina TaxID=430798 RepID=A0ABW4ZDR6_9BACT